ncbi:MAG: molybdenum cofactor biosynthesis protein MoaE [Thermoplasmata archaeon]|jgi:molybdopterin synthase catalytic subunit|nr:molybdenum cofactor biosynthesis protein MoaE [Thermoplasmata archaeon]
MKPIVRITDKPISVDEVLESVRSHEVGGTVCFIGTVRSSTEGFGVERMEVESSLELALADLERICREAAERFPVAGISVAHRTGALKVGDVIVAIAVSGAHRGEAFEACRFIIDELKKTTPIWKKEFGSEENRWVGLGM